MSRPSDYTQEIADLLCEGISDGRSLRDICAAEDMPARSTVFRWLSLHKEFSDQYARAKEAQADILFDEVLSIADQYDSAADKLDVDHIQRARLRIDARKWMAGKLRPKKYGEKLELAGDPDAPLHMVTKIELVAPDHDDSTT
jgi:hypothetical protein